MNSALFLTAAPEADGLTASARQSLLKACARVAPAWPLDQQIAVNPWWGMREATPEQVAARLAVLSGVSAHCSLADYRAMWRSGAFTTDDLLASGRELGKVSSALATRDLLEGRLEQLPEELPPVWQNLSRLLDEERDHHLMSWQEALEHQISQFCLVALNPEHPLGLREGECLYQRWHADVSQDAGLPALLAAPSLPRVFRRLPAQPEALLTLALHELRVAPELITDYAHALLLDVNGWASRVAWEQWQLAIRGQTDADRMLPLLAIRMAWELALWRLHQAEDGSKELRHCWLRQQQMLSAWENHHAQWQLPLRLCARACELAYQRTLAAALERKVPAQAAEEQPTLLAVFCIDVRSEPMRRALERQHPGIRTSGFAGFFGLPIAYQPVGGALSRPQLPGLLAPGLTASESGPEGLQLRAARERRWNRQAGWKRWSQSPVGMFSLVESFGLAGAGSLLQRTLARANGVRMPDEPRGGVRWALYKGQRELTPEERVGLAHDVLTGLDLPSFADLVMLVGHESRTSNNPQACSLDCGACGGQSGAVNVQVLADLLNHPEVRAALSDRGWAIPEQTRFIAALHETTSNSLEVFAELGAEPQRWLDGAARLARRWRAEAMMPELAHLPDADLWRELQTRSGDWSEVRPEWGLAGNAAFIIAPRERTIGVDLAGRCFLHDYHAERDPGYRRLEQIMTAPMLVTHWINMQYNTSVWDNRRYGSGNKVLHNVADGQLGVFEGQGGDLRIGLAMQSLHDGEHWRHQPVRLSVYIEAPTDAVLAICQRHAVLRELVGNRWLHLFCLDAAGRATPLGMDSAA
ncbi:DUF2309 domain-containing protein [Pseudomonas sp.]|uniref:DUF2309 domain-containing protein n=1 Tax=Pseudomonas sp. TaxID=306 RepID=UPI00272AC9BF|nr:DUF2309 domain-containing protein [Pseudomonas sp.]